MAKKTIDEQITIEQPKEAKDKIAEIYDDGFAEINGTEYTFNTCAHIQRCSVFSFMTKYMPTVENGDFSFLDAPEFKKVNQIIEQIVTVDGMQVSKLPNYWDKHPEDFLIFITTAFAVISYPFTKGMTGN